MSPYAVLGQREQQRRPIFAGCIFIHNLMLSAIAGGALVVAGLTSPYWNTDAYSQLLLVLGCVLPFVLLHGFSRRLAIAHMKMRNVLVLDLVVALIQIAVLLLLVWNESLTAASALVAIGLSSALGGTVWLFIHRSMFSFRWSEVRAQFAVNWQFGRWILAAQQVRTLHSAVVLWFLAAFANTTAAGIYAACAVVVTAANPLLLGLSNIMEPKAARAFVDGGQRDLGRIVRKVTIFVFAVIAIYWVVIAIIGEPLIAWLFDNEVYLGHGHTIVVLAAGLLVRSVRIGWSYGLRAMGAPQWGFYAGSIELMVIGVICVPLMTYYGVVGAAYCVLVGSVIGSLVRYYAFTKMLRSA